MTHNNKDYNKDYNKTNIHTSIHAISVYANAKEGITKEGNKNGENRTPSTAMRSPSPKGGGLLTFHYSLFTFHSSLRSTTPSTAIISLILHTLTELNRYAF